jgi:transposase-like protein
MELNILLTLDLREQAALQAALVTHGAPDALVTLALTGACRISSIAEARQLRKWLAQARTAGQTDFASLHIIERALIDFGL